MMHALTRLSNEELRTLSAELKSGRLGLASGAISLARWYDSGRAAALDGELQRLAASGFSPFQVAMLIDHLLDDRQRISETEVDRLLELVTTRPEHAGTGSRNTSAVVQSLFASAMHSVDVVGFAVYQGRHVFRVLADRMREVPHLHVRMFLNIARQQGDTSMAGEIEKRFVQRFRTHDWPANAPLPELFYDSRSLDAHGDQKATLHAKCVIVDGNSVFISSANFTEAAHERNLEVGVLIRSDTVARRLTVFLDELISRGIKRID